MAQMEKISEETYEFLMGGAEPTTTFQAEGGVEVMEPELEKYYREYLVDMGYSESEIDEMGEPLVIKYVSFTAVRVIFFLGLGVVVVAIFLVVRRYTRE